MRFSNWVGGWAENFIGRTVHRLKSSYDDVIFYVDDFLFNGIQKLQYGWKKRMDRTTREIMLRNKSFWSNSTRVSCSDYELFSRPSYLFLFGIRRKKLFFLFVFILLFLFFVNFYSFSWIIIIIIPFSTVIFFHLFLLLFFIIIFIFYILYLFPSSSCFSFCFEFF